MTFKEILEEDNLNIINSDEFAEDIIYNESVISGIFDQLADGVIEGTIYSITFKTADVQTVKKNDTVIVRGKNYKVLTFDELDGITYAMLNKA